MLWPSTLVGVGAGFAVASIPGALLGALIGQVVDRRLKLQSWVDLRQRLSGKPMLREDELLFVLLGRLAKSGGRVSEAHISQAREEMRALQFQEAARGRAIAAFSRGKEGKDRLEPHLALLRERSEACEGLLRACWRMAWADGSVGREERGLLLAWGKAMGWTHEQIQDLGRDYQPRANLPVADQYRDALALLGVTAQAGPDAIKQAYRRLLSRHHPDKLAGRGASAAAVRDATERTRELHNAYTLIRRQRGF